jgi:type II secretory pathway pseudopilin PulG
MICPHCGNRDEPGVAFCTSCHAPLASGEASGPVSTSGKAIGALVLGILGITCFWIVTGIPAILLGFSARKEIRRAEGRLAGKGLATAGIITGFCSIVFSFSLFLVAMTVTVAVPNFTEAQLRAKISRSKADERNLATALETYRVDHNRYPYSLHILTTPVAYITSIPFDPFAEEGAEIIYDYVSDYKSRWLLRSLGPDRDADTDLQRLLEQASDVSDLRFVCQPWEFDPTNGTVSSGDILRAGP